MRISIRHSIGHSMGHSMPHGMRNGVRSLRMACEWHAQRCMRCTPPAAAPKTSDESPPWHAQLWHAPRHAP